MENEINHEKMPLSMGQIRPDILVLAEGFGQSALGYVSRVPEDSLASQDDSLVLSPAYVLEPLGQAPVKIIYVYVLPFLHSPTPNPAANAAYWVLSTSSGQKHPLAVDISGLAERVG